MVKSLASSLIVLKADAIGEFPDKGLEEASDTPMPIPDQLPDVD